MLSRRKALIGGTSLLVAGGAYLWTTRSASGTQSDWYAGAGGYACDGADVVAYHGLESSARGISGSDEFTTEWSGAKWRFVSSENRDEFLRNPNAYAPQYGGYCAWAMARGAKAHGDVDAWMLLDGKLYMNYSARVRRWWQADMPKFIAQADEQWPALRAKS